MKTNTRSQIIDFINKNKKVRPHDLISYFKLSPVSIHKHLSRLVEQGLVRKVGSAPLVFYQPSSEIKVSTVSIGSVSNEDIQFLENYYMYVSPEGHFLMGLQGFEEWARRTKQIKQIQSLIQEYKIIRMSADQFYKDKIWIEALDKFEQTFSEVHLNQVCYQDFYSLPKFGKTKLGQYVLHAKQSQDKKLIAQLADQMQLSIQGVIKKYKIEAVGWVPHSIVRKVPFLKELQKSIHLSLPTIQIVKAYPGKVSVAQKTLSKLEERILNAKNTIFIKESQIREKRILIIDDAVGSGSTLNETALKLKEEYQVSYVLGFAIVGSYKGFEVIKEV